MRRALVVVLLSSALIGSVPRDGGFFARIQAFLHRAFHGITTTGDGLTPPKP